MWVLHSSLYCLALWRYRRRNPSKSRPLYDWTTAIVWCPTFNFHFTFGRNNTYFLWHSNKMNVLIFTIMWCICCSYGRRLIVSLMCVCVCVCVKIHVWIYSGTLDSNLTPRDWFLMSLFLTWNSFLQRWQTLIIHKVFVQS